MARAIVVGAGPTGLSAALALARSGHEITLVEMSERAGGMAASIEIDGIRVDLGSHRLHPVAAPRVENLFRELLDDDLQTRVRHGRLRLGGNWVAFPLRATDLLTSLRPAFAGRAMLDTLTGPIRTRRSTDSVDDASDTFARVVGTGLGPTMLDEFYGPYAVKLWGLPADRLAGELARRRIAASTPGRLVAKVARSLRREPMVFRYPRLGYGQVVDRLVDACDDAGVAIEMPQQVRSIDLSDPAAAAVTLGDDSVQSVDRVVWTAPLPALAAAVSGVDTAPTASLRHRAMVLVYLVFEGPAVTEFDAHYLPGPDELAARISEPINYRDGPDPDDRTVLCCEVVCDVDDDVWNAPPDDLGRRLADDLHRLGVTDRTPSAVRVHRLPHVYPVLTPESLGPIRRVLDWSQGLDRVTVTGRQGLFVADNLHHVIDMGLEVADCLGHDGSWDSRRWTSALTRFDGHVVED